jgi:hypothetical protein
MATLKYFTQGNRNPSSIYMRLVHGRNVDATICIITLILAGMIVTSCASRKSVKKDNYTFEFLKSSDKLKTYLTLRPHDESPADSKLTVPVFTYVNNLLFTNYPEGKIQDRIVLEPKPGTNINIEVYGVGYKSVNIERLKLERGDSLLVDVYMKESDEPLYESK